MALSVLVQFVFRLSFGLALSMALTPAKKVTSGFYRVHLWVVLGLATLAALAVSFDAPSETNAVGRWPLAVAVALGVVSYVGAVAWLYEFKTFGVVTLVLAAALSASGALLTLPGGEAPGWTHAALRVGDVLTSGLLVGSTLTAMFLGHWYLNTPTMQLSPLRRLVILMGVAVGLRAIVSGVGLGLEMADFTHSATVAWFVGLRWLSGIGAVALLVVMTWQTLKIPNTQSATGILYVGVICCFLGELTSQLLSVETHFPL